MVRLLLVRHATADWPDGVDDLERPVTGPGAAAARELGAYMAAHDLTPDAALVSVARRTRQTWEHLAGELPDAPTARFEEDAYAASARRLLQVVRERGGDAETVLVVGHNPGIHDLVAVLSADRERVPLSYPTTTLAVLDLPADGWSGVEVGTASVERVVVKRSR